MIQLYFYNLIIQWSHRRTKDKNHVGQLTMTEKSIYQIYVIMDLSVAYMKLTVEEIKEIVRSEMIDHQQLRVVDLRKYCQY